ncbi:ABC transporter [Agromyces luteolus]|uniref:ATP-binding cassette domain-containing protein n=1 Tax=Agromyces luteolus TaxID=88373 RepID=A0A7C9LFY2_9MICO|nr:ABC transporter ATP-binding protein [Agromyces luteolus]MUN06615.1 ATP-binding cassette domain-containing protein [Agromyces luteolus]GLK29311.1 ABC transporter [Agromyces luteolus]
MTTDTGAAVSTRGLTKRYGATTALHGLDLDIPRGSVFGMIGPNGAGKTTTMRLLLDIIRPTAGELVVLGRPPREGGAELRRRIGYLPGELHLGTRVKGREFLAHYAEISGPVRKGAVDDLADRLGVDLGRPVRSLSKGNKQKVGLIQAFMHEPELLVLDEPTSGLDPLVQQEFHAMLHEAKAKGQTVFLSSHVLSEVQQTALEIAILKEGRIVEQSTVAALRENAVRHVKVVVAETDAADARATLDSLPGVAGLAAAPNGPGTVALSATLDAHVDAFVKAVARLDVIDLTMEEPDLEEMVLAYYGTDVSSTAEPVEADRKAAKR